MRSASQKCIFYEIKQSTEVSRKFSMTQAHIIGGALPYLVLMEMRQWIGCGFQGLLSWTRYNFAIYCLKRGIFSETISLQEPGWFFSYKHKTKSCLLTKAACSPHLGNSTRFVLCYSLAPTNMQTNSAPTMPAEVQLPWRLWYLQK